LLKYIIIRSKSIIT